MSSRRVQVRRAASDDVDAVVRLHEPLHRMHVEALPAEYVPFDAVGTRTYYAQVPPGDGRGSGAGRGPTLACAPLAGSPCSSPCC